MPGTFRRWREKLEEAVERLRGLGRQPVPRPLEIEPRLGLALGGGFARGLAHIGVLKVLEQEGLRVNCLAGTSAGSIIAGAYASGVPLDDIARVARTVRWKDFGRWTLSTMGLATNERLDSFVRRIFRALRFEDLRIPLAVVATDLVAAKPVVFTEGELGLAIRASCAYPGLFLPVSSNGSLLVDGMLVSSVPTDAARTLGADVVVAVSLDNLEPGAKPRSMTEVLSRSFNIAQRTAEPLWRRHADLVVEPEVRSFAWDDFARADELIVAGERAARAALPRLRRLLQPRPLARAAAL
jgi:NTE family protein